MDSTKLPFPKQRFFENVGEELRHIVRDASKGSTDKESRNQSIALEQSQTKLRELDLERRRGD